MKNIYKCPLCGAYTEYSYHCNSKTKLLLDGRRRLRLSKLLSFLLRHDPQSIGLHMDREGWVNIDELVKNIKEKWIHKDLYTWLTKEHVIAIAYLDPKGRFEVYGNKIRARYGHEKRLNVNIRYEVDLRTKILYHGTIKSNLESIMKYGIRPMKRKYVHLTTDVETACETGRRHGHEPIYLIIDAECLRSLSIKIYIASRTVRLVDIVPPQCIKEFRECS